MEKVSEVKRPKRVHKNKLELEKKWGKRVADKGWVAIPKLLIQNQYKLNLTANELSVLLVLLSEWWGATSPVMPSARRIGEMTGKSERTVYKLIKSLAEKDRGDYQEHLNERGIKGLITVRNQIRKGRKTSNRYTFDGLYWLLNVIGAEATLDDEEEYEPDLKREELEKAVEELYARKDD